MLASYNQHDTRNKYEGALYSFESVCVNGYTGLLPVKAILVMMCFGEEAMPVTISLLNIR